MWDSRKLVEECCTLLNLEQQEEKDRNMAQSPVIITFLGKITYGHMSHVKNVLDSNFANRDYIQYLYVYYEKDTCIVENALTVEAFSNLQEAVQVASVKLLGTDDYVFEMKDIVYFECILSTREERAFEYFDRYLEMEESHGYNAVKTLYLMIDQESREYGEQAQKLIDRILAEEKEHQRRAIHNTYLLSNLLENGTLLLEKRIWQNYRLVADLILLGNARKPAANGVNGIKLSYSSLIHDGVMTAAYSFMGKQIDEIARVSLYYLMKLLYEKEELACQRKIGEEKTDAIKELLGISAKGMDIIRETFQNEIVASLPEAEELQWLPWKDYKAYKRSMKERRIEWQNLNKQTGGVLDAYYAQNYEAVIREEIGRNAFQEKFRRRIQDLLTKNITFFDILYYFSEKQWGEILHDMKTVLEVTARRSLTDKTAGKALIKACDLFSEWAKKIVIEEINALYGKASRLSGMFLGEAENVMQIGNNSIDRQMEQFYKREVQQFVNDFEGESPFCVDNSIEDTLKRIYEIFGQLIQKRSVYKQPFEMEMESRLEDVSEQERRKIIKNQINEDIGNQGRLRLLYDYRNSVAGTFCMINSKSVYKEYLGANNRNGRVIVFDLNRRDCLEMVEVYSLEKPERIQLGDG